MKIGWVGLVALLAACDGSERGQLESKRIEIGASIPGAPAAGPIHFRFAPPDRTEFVQTVFNRVKREGGGRPINVFEREQKIAAKIRRSESGYVMTSEVLSVRAWHNGDRYDDPYLAQRIGKGLAHRYDDGGRLISMKA